MSDTFLQRLLGPWLYGFCAGVGSYVIFIWLMKLLLRILLAGALILAEPDRNDG